MLRTAVWDLVPPAPAAAITGAVAAADRALLEQLAAIERAGGQTAPQARQAARQALAERDRILTPPKVANPPQIAPERLIAVVDALIAALDPTYAAEPKSQAQMRV
jgi:hypothetical protein